MSQNPFFFNLQMAIIYAAINMSAIIFALKVGYQELISKIRAFLDS